MNAHTGPYLGSLCARGHDHEGTGRSLRGPKGECIDCVREVNRERAARRRTRWASSARSVPALECGAPGPEPDIDAPPSGGTRAYHAERMCSPHWVPSEGPLTLEECGARMGVTRERVRQIELAALRKLRKRFGWLLEFLLPTHDPQARGPYR